MNNIVNLYKPVGPTSFFMVQSVKRALKIKKAGHIGTLDPKAEGVLPICLDRSTRLIQFLVSLPKVYLATMTLGTSTDTQDATGKVLATRDASKITEDRVRQVLSEFVGEMEQMPPMYSAKKKNGVPLYKLARNGI
ncbi:MAG: tRNA pseudouridine(55) synthase TruB, partial [Nitrospinaceae bacterium]|nr:tRNA pseudouridine(55) synthase TruB [Nitrospinaceae bacterium]NIR54614.1 tRNA pseudouridine(55) synthase TruB [Nitrospinaceae bacterium]NIS85031.1 tRNA pseudouridine(55) synthase TruB [Nitrospinaceae bacterium]NIT81847.1 tRNA pseudouridine(55) synthase TruB [Nitrospinaceae bacterium]NIU44112.1 tRNA pseudouridine(55) synthase TruB [Nitrospinaceae bacterium]